MTKFHWQPREQKEFMAEDVRQWVHRTSDAEAKLKSLSKLTASDLAVLMLACQAADLREIKLRNRVDQAARLMRGEQ